MSPIKRFKEYLECKKIKLKEADELLKLSAGYISKQINANASLGSEMLSKILSNYHDLNPVWLLTGGGEMLLSNEKTADNKERQGLKLQIEMYKDIVKSKDAEIEWHKHRIDKLQQQVISLGHKPVESD